MENLFSSEEMFGSKELCEVYLACLVIMCIIWAVMVVIGVVIYSVFQAVQTVVLYWRAYNLMCHELTGSNDTIENSSDIKDSTSTGDALLDFVLEYDASSDDVDLWR